jgi:hypothetical protein
MADLMAPSLPVVRLAAALAIICPNCRRFPLYLRVTLYIDMCSYGHCWLTDKHIHDMQLRWLAYAVLPYHCVLWCMWRFS